jgi:hypothetical protein
MFGLAVCVRASIKAGGNALPRLSARRRIPRHALGLKKNLGATSRSKTSDNEHTAAALCHSVILSVKYPPAHAIPAFDQPAKDDGKISSAVAG